MNNHLPKPISRHPFASCSRDRLNCHSRTTDAA
jgi:hypothetical protein